MKKLFTLLALTVLALAATPERMFASHLAGGEITYAPTGNPNEFLIKLAIYRDCIGITLPTSYDLCYQSAILGVNGTVNVIEVSVDSVGSSPCVQAATSCIGSQGDIEIHRYEGTMVFPAQTTDWLIVYDDAARNAAITTLIGGDLYVEALLNNLDAPTNTSPSFLNPAYTRFCVGNLFNYAQDVVEPDGDSIVFTLIDARQGTFLACPQNPLPVTYLADPLSPTGALYSGIYPFSSSTGITINDSTGNMQFTPAIQQVAVIAVLVTEYRNGIRVGSVLRDIQIKITQQCRLIQPAFSIPTIGGSQIGGIGGGNIPVNCNDYTIILPLDTLYPIQCASAIPSDFRTLAPYGTPNPVIAVAPLNCMNGYTDSLLVTFLNPLSAGVTKLWSKKGFDGNTFLGQCGFELIDSQDTVYLYVDTTAVTTLGIATDSIGCIFSTVKINLSDSIYCYSVATDGSDFTMTDANGTVYPIANAAPYCGPNSLKTDAVQLNMVNNVSTAGPIYVTVGTTFTDGNTLYDDCGRQVLTGDTVAILYVNNKIYTSLGTDQNICGDSLTLSADIQGLQYTWYNGSTVIAGQTSYQLPVNTSGTYSVVINNGPACSGSDTVNVALVDAPVDNLGNDIVQCVNDPAPTFDAGNTGAQYQWYFNGLPLAGDTLSTLTPNSTTSGTYNVLVTTGGVCQASFDILLNTFNNFPVNTLANETICAGSAPTQLDAGPAAATVGAVWSFNGTPTGATGQFFTPGSTSGTYDVTVGTGACASNSSMTLTVVAAPTVSLSNVNLCDSQTIPTLSVAQIPGATYQWNQNGNPIPGATTSQYTPTTADNYSVDVTVNPGCTSTASMSLTINSTPVYNISDTTICEDGTATISVSVASATYSWSNGVTTPSITTDTAGTFILTVTANGCSKTDTASIFVNSYPVAPVVVCGLPDKDNNPGNYTFVYTWNTINGAVSYEISEDNGQTWVPANGSGGVAESHGTTSNANLLVRAIGSGPCPTGAASEPTYCDIDFYNVISPNGDGKNDFFKIINIEQYPNNNVQIFNRWGKEVFSQDNYSNSDRKFEGKDLPEGTYYFIINLNQEGKEPKTGVITIIR